MQSIITKFLSIINCSKFIVAFLVLIFHLTVCMSTVDLTSNLYIKLFPNEETWGLVKDLLTNIVIFGTGTALALKGIFLSLCAYKLNDDDYLLEVAFNCNKNFYLFLDIIYYAFILNCFIHILKEPQSYLLYFIFQIFLELKTLHLLALLGIIPLIYAKFQCNIAEFMNKLTEKISKKNKFNCRLYFFKTPLIFFLFSI